MFEKEATKSLIDSQKDEILARQSAHGATSATTYDTPQKDAKDIKNDQNDFMGMVLKKETTRTDVFMLFYLPFMGMVGGGFVNAQMTFLLQSESHFSIS